MDLVAPIIPDAQKNMAASIALQAIGQGLQASAQFAKMRRESEENVMRLAQNERLAEEQLSLEKEKMAMDFDIRQSTLDSTRTLNEAHAEYYRAGAEAYATGTKTALQRTVAFNQQRQALVGEVNKHAEELNLYDPVFRTKEPTKFAANVLKFEDAWSMSDLPEVKSAVTDFRRKADEQKISIKMGATHDPLADKWSGGETKTVPIWQVVKNLQDPETQEETMNALMASGHTRIVEEFQDFNGTKVPVKRTEPSPRIKSALESGKDVKFEREKSRVPAAMLPKSAAAGTEPTELPVDIPPDMTTDPQASARQPQFEATETDKMLENAKAAIARGAPMPAVAARLSELGIDPSQLWAS